MAELEKHRAQAAIETRNIEVIKTAIAAVDKGNLEVFQSCLAPEFKLYVPSNSAAPVSRDDYLAMVKMMTTAIPDMVHNITELLAVQDQQLGMELRRAAVREPPRPFRRGTIKQEQRRPDGRRCSLSMTSFTAAPALSGWRLPA